MQLKKLPIGIQTFQNIINEGYLYIDKTKEAYELIENYKYTFLSRPRRFGKSLFLDTLQEIFQGNAKLFKGLYIYDKWDWSQKYPVIKISFSGDLRSQESLKENILATLKDNQEALHVRCVNNTNIGLCLKELIKRVYEKHDQHVVVLIDEYDKAILDNLDQMDIAIQNRESIKSFYAVLKDSDRYLKFVFLTGVIKFSRASIFSGLNMLSDISLNRKFGNICGYTQKDVERTFLPYLDGADLQKVKEWYNGYNFLKDDVYNPFDLLEFIQNEFKFSNYWFVTGTPTFLIKLIEKNNYFLPKLSNLCIGEELLDSFDIENINFEVILYQTGYLTIDYVEVDEDDALLYHLKLPNKEVRKSFNNFIINYLYKDTSLLNRDLAKALRSANLQEFETMLRSIFASIPYNNFTNNTMQNYEGFYASVVYVYLQSLGLEIIGEDVTHLGRIDLSVKTQDSIYLIEFKVGSEDALSQIKEKKYYEKYLKEQKDIYLIGINFDKKEKQISKFEYEKLRER